MEFSTEVPDLNEARLEGKSAIITGASAGLGYEMASALAEAGANVTICGRDSMTLKSAIDQLDAAGHKIAGCQADVTSEEDRKRLAAFVKRTDILVNNVGVAHRRPWQEITYEDWQHVMDTNIYAAFRLCQMFVPQMVELGWGRVINVSSVYGISAGDARYYDPVGLATISYFASKHGLVGLTKFLAAELGPTGVTVNTLSPGMFPDTPANKYADPAIVRRLAEATPLRRVGESKDIRAAVAFLAGHGAGFVTGHNLVVDGGWTIW